MFEDFELDLTAVGISLAAVGFGGLLFVRDVLGAGMSVIPIGFRVMALVIGFPVCYFFASYLLNK